MSRQRLPLIATTDPRGGRSRMTCTFRCGNACAHPSPNRSGNPHIAELLSGVVARRTVLRGAAAAGAAAGVLTHLSTAAAATGLSGAAAADALTFRPVAPNNRDNVTVPIDYDYDVVIKWGDRVLPGAPRFDVYNQTPRSQAQQFGYNCDYATMLPTCTRGRGRSTRH
jgi:secreted PhoX family phosphatase